MRHGDVNNTIWCLWRGQYHRGCYMKAVYISCVYCRKKSRGNDLFACLYLLPKFRVHFNLLKSTWYTYNEWNMHKLMQFRDIQSGAYFAKVFCFCIVVVFAVIVVVVVMVAVIVISLLLLLLLLLVLSLPILLLLLLLSLSLLSSSSLLLLRVPHASHLITSLIHFNSLTPSWGRVNNFSDHAFSPFDISICITKQ